MKNWIIVLVVGGLLLGGAGVWYVFFKPHRNFAEEAPAYKLAAERVIDAYQANEKRADSLYLNEVVAMKGRISSIKKEAVVLSEVVYCQLDSTITLPEGLKEGDPLVLKGRVLGYDALFSQIRMDHCKPYREE